MQRPTAIYPPYPAPRRIVALGPLERLDAPDRPTSSLPQILTGQTQREPDLFLLRPIDVAVQGDSLLVVDVGLNAVLRVDPRTGRLQPLVFHGQPEVFRPAAVAVDDQGAVYVADAKGGLVVQATADGTVVQRYDLRGQPFRPVDVAAAGDRLYVVNRAARTVEIFHTQTGEPIGRLGMAAAERPRPSLPVAVAVDSRHRVYVVDMTASRVRVYNADGELLSEFGRPGDRPGLLAQPRDVAVGPDGTIFVSDIATQVVQAFDSLGQPLAYFGGVGDGVGHMTMPTGLVASPQMVAAFASWMPPGFEPQYMLFVANQFSPPRVEVYAYGRMPETPGEAASR